MSHTRFSRLLAAKLADQRCPASATSRRETIRTGPFDALGPGLPRPVPGLGAVRAYPAADATPPPHPRRRIAPARLNGAQRDALTALRKLGAPLSDDFDARQLKSAFRTLALDLHPDRHPQADPAWRQRLELRFAVLCEAYRTLRTLDRR